MTIRPAAPDDIAPLARLWHEGWHDAHAHAPAGLVAARTLERFAARIAAAPSDTFVAGPAGAPTGFFMLKDDELYQFFVGRAARGSGLATTLMAEAEAALARRGIAVAWLACAIGNNRAARFYEKSGWVNARTIPNVLETPDGAFPFPAWRYEKAVR